MCQQPNKCLVLWCLLLCRASLEVKQDEFEKLRESAKEIQERESGAQAEVEKLGQAIQHCINEAESCREAQKETERSTEVSLHSSICIFGPKYTPHSVENL